MKNMSRIAAVAILLAVGCLFVSCDNGTTPDPLAIIGTWADTEYPDSQYVITTTQYTNIYDGKELYAADIVSYDNTGWNGNEAGSGAHGFMVIRFTGDGTSAGQYTVVRWQNFNESAGTVNISEGVYGWNDPRYFDTAQAAIDGVTADAGYFGGSADYQKQ